jgi:hypothetical protein
MTDISRRKLQIGLVSVVTGSMAGCIASRSVQDSGGSGDGSSDDDSETNEMDTDAEEDEKESEPADLSQEQLVYNSINDMFSVSSWLANDMGDLLGELIITLREVDKRLDKIVNEFDDDEITSQYIKETANILREAQQPADVFVKYFDDVFSYEWYAGEIEETLLTSLDRNEYQDLRNQAKDFQDRVSDHLVDEYQVENYPLHYVNGQPYLTFSSVDHQYEEEEDEEIEVDEKINNIEWQNMYELYYHDSSATHPFYVLPGVMDVPYYPFDKNVEKQELFNPGIDDPRDRESSLLDDSSWLSVEDGRSSELYMNIHPYELLDSNYPDETFMLRHEEDLSFRNRLDQPNLNDSDPIRIYIQKFADEASASAAVESIKETRQTDGQRTLFDTDGEDAKDWESNKVPLTFDKVYAVMETDDGTETLYADLLQNGEYVIAFGVEDEQWSTRELLDKRFENEDEYESIEVERVLYQSWLNVHDPVEE